MCQLKFPRFAGAVVLAAALAATPALAAPAPDASPSVGALQVLADWWAELTEPVVGLFASSLGSAEPDDGPTIETTSDGPDADTEARMAADPNG